MGICNCVLERSGSLLKTINNNYYEFKKIKYYIERTNNIKELINKFKKYKNKIEDLYYNIFKLYFEDLNKYFEIPEDFYNSILKYNSIENKFYLYIGLHNFIRLNDLISIDIINSILYKSSLTKYSRIYKKYFSESEIFKDLKFEKVEDLYLDGISWFVFSLKEKSKNENKWKKNYRKKNI